MRNWRHLFHHKSEIQINLGDISTDKVFLNVYIADPSIPQQVTSIPREDEESFYK